MSANGQEGRRGFDSDMPDAPGRVRSSEEAEASGGPASSEAAGDAGKRLRRRRIAPTSYAGLVCVTFPPPPVGAAYLARFPNLRLPKTSKDPVPRKRRPDDGSGVVWTSSTETEYISRPLLTLSNTDTVPVGLIS